MSDRHNQGGDRGSDASRDPWLERIRSELDASARDLDAATLSRLNRARQAALDAAHAGRFGRRYALRWPAALAAALSLVLAIGFWNARAPGDAQSPGVAVEDLELIASEDSLELYDEDLEFYAWLDAQSSSEG